MEGEEEGREGSEVSGRRGGGKEEMVGKGYGSSCKFGNFQAVENNGTAFAPKQCLYQKVAVGMENPKMQPLSRCNKCTGRYCP